MPAASVDATIAVSAVIDATPPSAPSNLSAALKGKRVILAWKAASDANGIASYAVRRSGVLLAQVGGSTLSYTDDSNVRGSFTYTIVAADAAGNLSAPSNAVTVSR